MKRKVVQWGTGEIGRRALELIIGHPGLELTGVIVSNPEKAGRDAAELCGLAQRTGVKATLDVEAALATNPDALCYMAVGTGEGKGALVRGFRGCLHCVAARDRCCLHLRDAARLSAERPAGVARTDRGRLPGRRRLVLLHRRPSRLPDGPPAADHDGPGRDKLTIWEIISYETWSKPDKLRAHFGLGMPESYAPPVLAPGAATHIYGSVLSMMADLLGVTFDKVEERTQHWFTPAEMPTCGGSIAAGTRGAIWFGLHGMVGGKDVIVLDHIYRAHPTAAPEWRQPPGSGGYALEIKGDPDWVVDFAFASREGSALHAGQFVTAVRAVNAIGAVCDAKPGLLTPMDLPLISGRDLFYAALPRT